MKTGMIIALVAVGLLFVAGCSVFTYALGAKRDAIALDETCKESWGNVQSAYQRRFDLLPNLANTVERYAKHEKGTLEAVAQARAMATRPELKLSEDMLDNPEAMKKFENARGDFERALSRLMMVQENYPDLKADKLFISLQDQLEGTENRIKRERDLYNQSVKAYNIHIQDPIKSCFIGGGYAVRKSFEAESGAEKAPTLFGDGNK